MKKITLSRGLFALVDDEDYEFLNQWKWYASYNKGTKSFYVVRNITLSDGTRKSLRMHRLILNCPDDMVVDHIHHDTLDNRRAHIRIVTHAMNLINRGKPIHNTSGYKGVTWHSSRGTWHARININKKRICLGYYHDIRDAGLARAQAEEKYYGDFISKSQL